LFVEIVPTLAFAVKFSGTSWDKREWSVLLMERENGSPIAGLP
jgi:hypothetical protein